MDVLLNINSFFTSLNWPVLSAFGTLLMPAVAWLAIRKNHQNAVARYEREKSDKKEAFLTGVVIEVKKLKDIYDAKVTNTISFRDTSGYKNSWRGVGDLNIGRGNFTFYEANAQILGLLDKDTVHDVIQAYALFDELNTWVKKIFIYTKSLEGDEPEKVCERLRMHVDPRDDDLVSWFQKTKHEGATKEVDQILERLNSRLEDFKRFNL